MGLADWLRSQLIDIIEWIDDDDRALVWRFPRAGHEIKHGARLIVREGQAAVLVHEGVLADVLLPGLHTLATRNLPILSSLAGWHHGFESPFKCEVYFINTRPCLDLKWGTLTPIPVRDPDFGVVRVRAYGVYAIQVQREDAGVFFREVVGTDGRLTTREIEGHLRAEVVAAFTDALGAAGIAVLDLAGNYGKVADACRRRMNDRFQQLGLSLVRFAIQNVSVPEEVEKALDQRASMGVLGNLDDFAKFQAAQALARGGGAAGAEVAAGLAMAHAMGHALSAAPRPPAPPQPAQPALADRLKQLKSLHEAGLIDDAAFAARRDAILAEI